MRKLFAVSLLVLALAAPATAQYIQPGGSGGGTTFTGGAVTSLALTETLGTEALGQNCTDWSLFAPVGAWSCSGDTITRTASGSDLVITNVGEISANKSYKVVVVTASVTAGTVTPAIGGFTCPVISTATTTTCYAPTSSTAEMTLTASAAFAGTITVSTTSAKPIASELTSSVGPVVINPATDLHVFGGLYLSGTITNQMQITPADNGTPLYLTSQAADTADGLTVIGGAARAAYFGRATAGSSHLVGLYQPSGDTGDFLYAVNNVTNVFRLTTGGGLYVSDPLLFTNDNTDDIGASGATRPRTGYFGTSVISPLYTHSGSTMTVGPSSANHLALKSGSAADVQIQPSGSTRWLFSGISPYWFGPQNNNAADFGASSITVRTGYFGTSLQGSGSKALTDNTATNFVKVAVAQLSSVAFDVRFTVKAADATDLQVEKGRVSFACANKAGTVTCATPVVHGNTVPLVTAGTLGATTFAISEVDADTVTVTATSDTSLTTTSHVVQYFVECESACTVTQNP